MKTRLMLVGEQGINTGFEKVVRGIATHLHERGDYEVIVRGIGFDPRVPVRRYPYTVKPIDAALDDIFGVRHFQDWILEDQPDVFMLVHDIWQLGQFLTRKPESLQTVAYFPVDAPCVKPSYALGLAAVAEAVTYTQFAARETAIGVRGALDSLTQIMEPTYGAEAKLAHLRTPRSDGELIGRWERLQRYQNPQNYNVVPHGAERGVFAPRDKARAKSMLGLADDAFVVLNVGTNSTRKRLDQAIRAFRQLYRHRSNAYLVLHAGTTGSVYSGWDLTAAAHYYGVVDRVLLSHKLYPNASDDELCWIYNAADVQVNTSGGEAWSLTQMEGAACGVPQIVPDWSGTRELWNAHGVLTPVKNVRMQDRFLNTIHCEVDTVWLGQKLVELSDDADERERLSTLALAQAERQHSWDVVGEAFHQIIQHAKFEPDATGTSFSDIREARQGVLESEGAID